MEDDEDVNDDMQNESDQNEDNHTEESKVNIDDINVGDIYVFGAYEQDNDKTNGKEKIEWQVFAKEGTKIFVISKYGLDAQPYNTEFVDVTWETCTLRDWLNDDFINTAFTNAEKAMIPTVTVTADKYPDYETDPGNDTQDKVFLLSIEEAAKYFDSDTARECEVTEYARVFD